MKVTEFCKLSLSILTLAFLSLGLFSCKKALLEAGEGKLPVPGGEIWYKVSGTGKKTPLVLIHGGPGASSYYLKPFEELGNDRKVIRYDQLGCGKSTYTEDTTMFTIERRVLELDSLRKALGINKWNLMGHSFGAIIALEYYAAYPNNVASLTFAGGCFDARAYAENVGLLLRTLPDSLRKAVAEVDTTGDYMNPLYQEAVAKFKDLYSSRKPDLVESDSIMATYNGVMNSYMKGPNEFKVTGSLKDYNGTGYLPLIKVPALFTVGEFDTCGPQLIVRYAEQVPNGKYYMIPDAANITMWDAKEESVKVVREFLLSVD